MDPLKLQEIEQEVLKNKRHYLVKTVKPEDIIDDLISQKLVGNYAKQQFGLLVTDTNAKVRIIVDELERSPPGFLKEFCEVLKRSRTQDHVVQELQKEFHSVKQSHGYPSEVEDSNGEAAKPRIQNVPKSEESVGELAREKLSIQIESFASVYGDLSRGAVHKWKQLGLQLGLESYELDAISADYKDDPEENMSKVFELWKQQSLKQTWNDLIEAIKRTRLNKQLYEDLKNNHERGLNQKVPMKDLSNEVLVPMAEHWYELGLELEIDETQLDIIPPANSSKFFRKMLQSWWQQNIAADRTWNKVVSALDAAKLSALAKTVYDNRLGPNK
ncbi:uncharacterized protein [Dysidea avara]|uniref:uncharacterized protein isoform X2 n=1 Tax=Dysidea avara TaxID=196820 RepID=UPI003321033B